MAVYVGNKQHFADGTKEWLRVQKEKVYAILLDAQKKSFEIYMSCDDAYAAERDRQVAEALACREEQLEKPDCDEKSIRAEYERKVDKAQALYEKNREVVYKIYRSRIDRATKKCNEAIKSLALF